MKCFAFERHGKKYLCSIFVRIVFSISLITLEIKKCLAYGFFSYLLARVQTRSRDSDLCVQIRRTTLTINHRENTNRSNTGSDSFCAKTLLVLLKCIPILSFGRRISIRARKPRRSDKAAERPYIIWICFRAV